MFADTNKSCGLQQNVCSDWVTPAALGSGAYNLNRQLVVVSVSRDGSDFFWGLRRCDGVAFAFSNEIGAQQQAKIVNATGGVRH
jgi:hypothetical protein